MDSPSPESLHAIHKSVIGKLLKGKESATELHTLFQTLPEDGAGRVSAQEHVLIISRSFAESLSLLNSGRVNGTSQIVAVNGGVGVSSGDRSSKSSDHGRKKLGVKDRRGCYRRRNASQSSISVSPTTEDGFAWRKYGQKEILNTIFPRCYFRCTHKYDQSCKANKQVQRIKEDPPLYQTTYFGHHTCQGPPMRAPQIISDSDHMTDSSCLLSFEAKPPTKQGPYFPNNHSAMMISTQELKKDETQSDASDNKSCLLQDLVTSESSKVISPYEGSSAHQDEVASSMQSCSSTPLHDGLDHMEAFSTEFADLDQDLYFNDMELF
ncbi:hypothetical protein ACH5RR_016904 [Cinchona calisaya]|uniref:WRKY domain-containing protein n=1 Tax=Cinchona calisaya TaxID=153742 RepID=A0ABD3A0P7_9GENT